MLCLVTERYLSLILIELLVSSMARAASLVLLLKIKIISIVGMFNLIFH